MLQPFHFKWTTLFPGNYGLQRLILETFGALSDFPAHRE